MPSSNNAKLVTDPKMDTRIAKLVKSLDDIDKIATIREMTIEKIY